MIKIKYLIIFLCFFCIKIHAQNEFILTKEGKSILHKRTLVNNCLWSLKKDRSDYTALSICDCQINKLDGYFSMKQYKKYTKNNTIDINGLINSDSAIKKSIEACYTNSGKTTLLQAESFGNEFISSCIKNIQKNTEKSLDSNKVRNFCSCQLELIKTRKITDAEIQTLTNPNSILFFEVMYKCGNPFYGNNSQDNNWNDYLKNDINGPVNDTIKILSINGMSYIKLKIGSVVQVWLFDTGASDLLINNDMEQILRKENIINSSNYLGVSEYEMANGIVDTCRRYSINNIQVGKFNINNIIIAVTDKGKRIIVGKSLLNKFSSWILDNKNNKLILNK
jgi:hypothetical protein